MQELFETNRYAAQLTHTRQNLLDETRRLHIENDALRAKAADTEHMRCQLDALSRETAQTQQTIHVVATDAEQMRRYIAAMYASTSWKFSRPVRAIAKLLGR